MTIYSEDSEGNVIVTFDSRWQFPEVFGYKPEDPQYKLLQKLWEETNAETIPEEATVDKVAEVPQPEN